MANFQYFQNTVAQLEGGYQNSRNDPGNKNSLGQFVGTMNGISAPVYERFIGRVPSVEDMKSITKAVAAQIFKINYWDAMKADFINSQAVAETFVDHGINAGVGTAIRIMQRVLNTKFGNNLAVDGKIGTMTLNAINKANSVELFNEFSNARIADYSTKNNAATFYNGWVNRVNAIATKFGIVLKKK